MKKAEPFVSTTNACKMCTPMGAALAFKGLEGCVPFLHGSQGCATYMRRYIISHFREPMDIASSSLGEKDAVYGGKANLMQGLLNVIGKYKAQAVGIATTCLTETIGDDVSMILHEFKKECLAGLNGDMPALVHVSTPSYGGSHMEGFHAAVRAMTGQLADPEAAKHDGVNLFSGFVSPEDIRHLQDIFAHFGLPMTILPDYSETLDGPALEDYQNIPGGGTPLDAVRAMSGARASIEFGRTIKPDLSAGEVLREKYGVTHHSLGLPIGLRESDALFTTLESLAGCAAPRRYALERGQLLDAMVDGHKYVAGKKAVVYGEEDLVVGITSFLSEIGVKPVLVASGGESGGLSEAIAAVTEEFPGEPPLVRDGVDFYQIVAEAEALEPDLVVGNSKGYRGLARARNIPLIRVGFPIHDRFGSQRVLHVGYRGALNLYDMIVNALIKKKQDDSPIGYGYI
ncbi:MAG: nitrogenase [Desulfovibrionales bacterium]|nr:MAG: nitrogenase [Desulfovibrionales bacterium]